MRPLLLCAALAAATLPAAAAPAPAEGAACQALTEEDGLQPLPGCALVDSRLQLTPAALARLAFDAHGLAAAYAGGSFHYITRQGRSQAVITWDNGPDRVEEGRLRGRVGTRIGYFDATLEPAFAATFDFGWPFREGIAEVCNGCRPGTPDADGHVPIEGGTHFQIDRRGHRVTPGSADTGAPSDHE